MSELFKEEAAFFLDINKDSIKRFNKILETASARIGRIQIRNSTEETFVSMMENDVPIQTKAVELTQEIEKLKHETAMEIYTDTESYSSLPYYLELAEAADNYEDPLALDGIEMAINDNGLLLKLPMLWRELKRASRTSSGNFIAKSSPFFRNNLRAKIHSKLDELVPIFSETNKKTVLFLFVYASDNSNIIDNDNHDTKGILDAICGELPGGDASLRCRQIYDSTVSADLSPCTLVTLIPQNRCLPTNEELIDFWQDFCNEKTPKKPV